MGSPALLAVHRAHGCADLVLLLVAGADGPRFAHLPGRDPVTEAGLTRREADVLVLLLGGLTTPAVAGRLGVSTSTARSHCRAVLRKLGAGDRRSLRALLLADSAGPGCAPLAGPLAAGPEGAATRPGHVASQVCPSGDAKFADECAVAAPGRASHT
jgi:DNA-binding CsgD family transcriptional regulator